MFLKLAQVSMEHTSIIKLNYSNNIASENSFKNEKTSTNMAEVKVHEPSVSLCDDNKDIKVDSKQNSVNGKMMRTRGGFLINITTCKLDTSTHKKQDSTKIETEEELENVKS